MQKKSHEALLRLLNNIGVIGAILAAVADIIFVIIAVLGINIEMGPFGIVLYSTINAAIGVLISVLLRYQGHHYAEIENAELCKQYYNKTIKEKKHMSMGPWMALKALQDTIIKGVTTAFCLFGTTYLAIEGSKNPIQILITLATLILFACFGLIAMNSAYGRFYNIQVPLMKLKIAERNADAEGQKGPLGPRGPVEDMNDDDDEDIQRFYEEALAEIEQEKERDNA